MDNEATWEKLKAIVDEQRKQKRFCVDALAMSEETIDQLALQMRDAGLLAEPGYTQEQFQSALKGCPIVVYEHMPYGSYVGLVRNEFGTYDVAFVGTLLSQAEAKPDAG